jgi:hypothetical protein
VKAVLWTLAKGSDRASAITRTVQGVGIGLVYRCNDEVRESLTFANSVELAAAAGAKRKELLVSGWVDAPPIA